MIGKQYLTRQAMILLRMSRVVRDPTISGPLAAKAADLTERLEATSSPASETDDAKTIPPPASET
jgi:hypothetical protein